MHCAKSKVASLHEKMFVARCTCVSFPCLSHLHLKRLFISSFLWNHQQFANMCLEVTVNAHSLLIWNKLSWLYPIRSSTGTVLAL